VSWLDADGYARALAGLTADPDPYLSPEYLTAAAASEEGELAAFAAPAVVYPFLVRPLSDGRCDITSAYGYGGPLGGGDWRSAFRDACRERGVVSEFIRFHPLLQNQHDLEDVDLRPVQDTVTVDTRLEDEGLLAQMQPTARNKLRKAERRGVRAHESRDLGRFHDLYHETMQRTDADEAYLFDGAYFAGLDQLGERLLMLDASCAAALFICGDGAMHYHLSGSTAEGRRDAATNLLLWEAMRHARERGLHTLHLGGGLRPGDALATFKQSIGAGRAAYVQGRAVHDAEAYRALCREAGVPADGEFFPAYRTPSSAPGGQGSSGEPL
jgi:Acetyltransferase (GNAT) domain